MRSVTDRVYAVTHGIGGVAHFTSNTPSSLTEGQADVTGREQGAPSHSVRGAPVPVSTGSCDRRVSGMGVGRASQASGRATVRTPCVPEPDYFRPECGA
ncbi:hypothetical protein GCM10012287_52380 [Streptomyces daqingensis]|uniref:Uncharacterized protein n=1 Tax=Streptomyces daqingensis TaxID=1472640 RepID=A0ABQ2MTI1_9ACTN|nr:hypothetical protein GCM10012287_52380 [Streptomyces daqingensis]